VPITYARKLTGKQRAADADRHLGYTLAFIAGAINAGGFLAVQQYTSHMTGLVSSMADHLILGIYDVVLTCLGALISFLLGAACSAIMVNYSRLRAMHSQYAFPLLLEAVLLLAFGILGARLAQFDSFFVPITVVLLCFIMGLQNALITKLSNAEIRTTHITGIVTDIGIELGKLLYWNASNTAQEQRIRANRTRLAILVVLGSSFFIGGVVGALGFKYIGYASTLPLAVLLIALAIVPAIDDLTSWRGRWRKPLP